MKRVYLIRHGLPDLPGAKKMCLGSTDLPLGETGMQQAREMAAKLPSVTALFSSPLIRAVQTARAISEPAIINDLRELHAGEWDGLTFDEIRLRWPGLYAARGTDMTIPLPGAEPDDAGLARFAAAMELAADTASGDFAVVAHGGVISLFLEKISGKRYKPDYCETVRLVWKNGTFTIEEEP